jgi:hypothetical protein
VTDEELFELVKRVDERAVRLPTGLRRIAHEVEDVVLERCARIAETPVSGEQDDITMAAKDRIAAAIRGRAR